MRRTCALARTARAALFAVVYLLGEPAPAASQPYALTPGPRVEARIRQVAGETVYLDLGTDHGLAVGDTVPLARALRGKAVGEMVVMVASTVRSVLSFADEPFALTRGEVVAIGLLREPSVAPPPVRDTPGPASPSQRTVATGPTLDARPPASETTPSGPPPVVPRSPAHGRWGLETAVSHAASTLGTAVDPVEVSRTFVTPALRFDMRAPGAVAGFDLRVSSRTTYRYGTDPGFQHQWAPRVYEFALVRQFEGAKLTLGRFHSPGESFSGYWDGASLRLGGASLGVGAMAGFQPDRWNQLPNSELPKATLFVDFDRRRGDTNWRGDISAHMAWPTDGAPTHTFFGFGQRITSGRIRISQELQVDRDPFAGGLRLTRLTGRASLRLSRSVDLRAGASRRETYLIWAVDPQDLFASQRDRGNLGFSVRGAHGSASFDVGLNRDVSDNVTRSVTGSLSLPRVFGSVGAIGSASWWDGDTGHAVSFSPSLLWSMGRARIRAGYRFYTSDVLGRLRTTHAPDFSLDLPLASRVRASFRFRSRWGDGLRSEYFQINLTRIF